MGDYSYETATTGPLIIDGICIIPQTTECLNGATPNALTSPTNPGRFSAYNLATGAFMYSAVGTVSKAMNLKGSAFSQAVASSTNALGSKRRSGFSYGNSAVPYLWGSTAGATGPAGEPTTVWSYYDPLTGILRAPDHKCNCISRCISR